MGRITPFLKEKFSVMKLRFHREEPTDDSGKDQGTPGAARRIFPTITGITPRWAFNTLLPTILILVICVGVASIAMSSYYFSTMRSQMMSSAETVSDFFNRYMLTNEDFYASARSFTANYTDKDTIEMQTISLEGELLYSSLGIVNSSATVTEDISSIYRTRVISSFIGYDSTTGEHILSVTAPIYNHSGRLSGYFRFVTSLKNADHAVTHVTLFLSCIGLLIFLIYLAVSFYFLRSIVRPLGKINVIARNIASGKYGEQIDGGYHDEIGELAETINYLSLEIARADKVRNDFISSVSHELRTPLTAITGWSETLSANNDNPALVKRGLSVITRESANLKSMLDELLDFSRIQSGRMSVHFGKVNPSDEIEDVIFSFSETLRMDNFEVVFEDLLPPETWFSADRGRFRQIVVILIDNARKHAAAGKKLDIRAEFLPQDGEKGERIFFSFRDYGSGITEEDLPHITEKFYKGHSNQTGSGIGLAVASELISLHGGQLIPSNHPDGGAVFSFELPMEHSQEKADKSNIPL